MENGTPEKPKPRRGWKANWAVLLVLMAVTWSAMAYLIYRVIASAKW